EKNGTKYKPITFYAIKNEEIKKYNKKISNVIHLDDYKTQKDYNKLLNSIRDNLHKDEKNIQATRLLVERVKGYVDYGVAKKLYIEFNNERNKWKLKIERSESIINSKRMFYSSLISKYTENKKSVKKYSYNPKTFKDEIKKELLMIQEEEIKINQEKEKFEELRDATIVSMEYQERLLDIEFSSVYEGENLKHFSYEEKYFAIKLLKDHNILLPAEEIKNEFIKQKKDIEEAKMFIPLWKQAKETLTSIQIYSRTINKLNKINRYNLDSDQSKRDIIIKLNSFKNLKESYENYLNEISPLIDEEINIISNE